MSIDNIIDQLKRDEGFRSTVYKDQFGKRTIGYGHNLDAHPVPDYTTMDETTGDTVLRADLQPVTYKLVQFLPWTKSVDVVRFGVLQNMGFNMGVEGLVGFHQMLSLMQRGLFSLAAADMINSKWYTEVGDRAKRLVTQMTSGVWQ